MFVEKKAKYKSFSQKNIPYCQEVPERTSHFAKINNYDVSNITGEKPATLHNPC